MSAEPYSVAYRINHGNMHIELEGLFDQNLAKECIKCLTQCYEGTGRVFLNTANLSELSECGINYFRNFLSTTKLVAHNLYLKGEQGFQIVPDGSKVLIMNTKSKTNSSSGCACGGKCGGANAKKDENGHQKCKVCKCAMAKARAEQKMQNIA